MAQSPRRVRHPEGTLGELLVQWLPLLVPECEVGVQGLKRHYLLSKC